jgi:hypothetical protein
LAGSWEAAVVAQLLQVLGLVMPLVLAWFTYSLNQDVTEAKKQIEANHARIEDLKSQADIATSELRQRIDKVKVINDYMEVLSGPDSLKRRLAIHVVMIVLPEEGPSLLREIAAGTDLRTTATAAAAKPDSDLASDTLATRRDALIQDLFSDGRPTRLAALTALRAGWLTDNSVFDPLVKQGTQQLAAKNVPGVFNALVLLNNMKIEPRGATRASVVSFAQAAAANSADSAQQSKMLVDGLK